MMVRDLHTILEQDKLRKRIRKAARISRNLDRLRYQKEVADRAAMKLVAALAGNPTSTGPKEDADQTGAQTPPPASPTQDGENTSSESVG